MSPKLRYVPSNKSRDSDLECRRLIIDCLTLLTATRFGRETMRTKKVVSFNNKSENRNEVENNNEKYKNE
jgi:hypothetical protein